LYSNNFNKAPKILIEELNLSDEELEEFIKYDDVRPIVKEWVDNYIDTNSITGVKDCNKLAKSILKSNPEYTLFSQEYQSLCFDLTWLFVREWQEILTHRRGKSGLSS
jgi:hypothetical protein